MIPKSIIIAGALAQKPHHGGHTWAILQYLLGFRRLGCEVTFLDRLEPADFKNDKAQPCAPPESVGFHFLSHCLDQFGFAGDWAIVLQDGQTLGLSRAEILARCRRSALLLNVMGFLRDEQILAASAHRVFLDIDPGFPQMWQAGGFHDSFAGHDAFVTVGAEIGSADCGVPTGDRPWHHTAPPVVLEHWPAVTHSGGAITSVASWRGAYGPVPFAGNTYGLRVHEFRKFIPLPTLGAMTGQRFELAVDIHAADAADRTALEKGGWHLIDPRTVAGSAGLYRNYLAQSAAEFCVAKNMYVRARTGWFSDRSACYLASGKPVVAQETAWSRHFPSGEGLLAFSTLDEAAAAVETIASDPQRHSSAARRIARDFFDSDIVLLRLLRELGVA